MGVLTFRNFGILERLVASGYLELIEDIEVTGSSVTSVQFSGFTATKEDTLVLVSDIQGNGTNPEYNVYANNNQTASNYWLQYLRALSTSVTGARVNAPVMSYLATVKDSLTISDLKITNDGYFTAQHYNNRDYGTVSITLQDNCVSSTFIITSLTQLDIVGGANTIGIGSRFSLYKIVGV